MKQIKNNLNSEAVSPVIGVMLMLVVTVIIAAVVSGFAGDMGLDKKTGPCVTLSKPVMEFSTAGAAEHITYRYVAEFHESTSVGGEVVDTREGTSDAGGGSFHIVTSVSDPYGLVFTHQGGDPIDLKELQMGFSSNDLGIVVDYNSWSDERRDESYHDAYEGPYYVGYTETTENDCGYGVWVNSSVEITRLEISGGYTVDDFDELQARVDSGLSDPGRYFLKINPETPDDTIIRTGDQFEVAMDGTPSRMTISATTSDGVHKGFLIEPGLGGSEWILSHKPSGQIFARGDLVYETTLSGLVF